MRSALQRPVKYTRIIFAAIAIFLKILFGWGNKKGKV
jgi:hypothetical protein